MRHWLQICFDAGFWSSKIIIAIEWLMEIMRKHALLQSSIIDCMRTVSKMASINLC